MCRENKTETKSPAETPTHQRGVLQFAAASSLPESFVFQPFEAAAAEAAARLKPVQFTLERFEMSKFGTLVCKSIFSTFTPIPARGSDLRFG